MITPPAFPPITVLLIDSSAYSRRIVRGMLYVTGIRQVAEAEDGKSALKLLQRFTPDLIIVDWDIPTVPAFDLISLVRDPERSSDPMLPVIGVSNAPTQRVMIEAATLKVMHVLRKPFAPKALWTRVERLARWG